MKKGTMSVASVTLGVGFAALVSVLQIQIASTASGVATDPGVRGGATAAGAALAGLTASERAYFNVGLEDFEEEEDIPDGLGPRMNLDSCAGCHIQPANGGFQSRDESADRIRHEARRHGQGPAIPLIEWSGA